jgi:hypothetical protein
MVPVGEQPGPRRPRPRIVVPPGVSAAPPVSRRPVAIGGTRGQPIPPGETTALVTMHASASPRMPDRAAKTRERTRRVADSRAAPGFARSER